MKKLLATAAIALIAFPAFANETHMTVDEKFAKYDMDKDGYLSKTEMEAKMESKADDTFAKIDANSDGKISKAEMTTWKDKKESM